MFAQDGVGADRVEIFGVDEETVHVEETGPDWGKAGAGSQLGSVNWDRHTYSILVEAMIERFVRCLLVCCRDAMYRIVAMQIREKWSEVCMCVLTLHDKFTLISCARPSRPHLDFRTCKTLSFLWLPCTTSILVYL